MASSKRFSSPETSDEQLNRPPKKLRLGEDMPTPDLQEGGMSPCDMPPPSQDMDMATWRTVPTEPDEKATVFGQESSEGYQTPCGYRTFFCQ